MKAKLNNEQKDQIRILAKTHTQTEISNLLNVNLGVIFSFCKKEKIVTKKAQRGGLNIIDLTGKIFDGLEILSKSDKKTKYSNTAWWHCKCLCGKIFEANGTDIRQRRTKSCGCRKSIISKRNWQGSQNIPKVKWSCIHKNALNRRINFELDIEYCDKLFIDQNKKCYLSGVDISFEDNTASLDRIDSSKPYIKGNVAWCHKDVNFMKQQFSKERFIEMCSKIHNFNN